MTQTEFTPGLISVVTPVYNAERFIADTINSVINQDYQNIEYLLVNDCSTDSSLQILENFAQKDSRIKVINHETNQGAAVARNTGLEAAGGQYIAFIDSDDKWLAGKLTKQIDFMNKNHHVFTYTDFALVNEDDSMRKEQANVPEKLDYTGLLKNTAIACSTVVIDRNSIGDFRMPLVRKGQDTATWLMIMRERDVAAYGLQEVLNHYRQVDGSISDNKLSALKRTWNTYYNLEGLPFHKAAYYFVQYALNALLRRL